MKIFIIDHHSYMHTSFQVQVFQVFIVLHCFLEKLINILYKNAEIKKKYRQLAREKTIFNRVQ